MAYKYLFKLNDVELVDVSIGVGIIEKLEEPLDEGGLHLPFTIRNYEYEMRGLLSITAEDIWGTRKYFDFLITSDRVTEGSKYGEWKHDLTVIEYSHKLDNYLIHSLAKTKSLKNTKPAPFNSYINISSSTTSFQTYVFLQPINVITNYYTGEPVTFPQVRQAYQLDDITGDSIGTYVRRNAFISTDATGISQAILSSGDVTWTFPKGEWYIDYGANLTTNTLGIPTGDQKIYRFYIRVIDREQISVLDLINLVRNNISKFGGIESKKYFNITRIFNIDPEIEEKLSLIEAPQTYIQKATARQVLNSIFLYVNAISRLKFVGGITDLLSMDEFNYIGGSFTVSDVAGYSSSQEATKLFNKGISWLERALPNDLDEATMETPAEGLYKTVRSTQIQLLEDKFEMKLERPIYEPKKLVTPLANIVLKSFNFSVDGLTRNVATNFDLDLTSRLPNKEEWDLKKITVAFPTVELQKINTLNVGIRENKVANLYWKQGDTTLSLSDPYGEVIQKNLVFNVIRETFNEYFTRNMQEPLFTYDDKMVFWYIYTVDDIFGASPDFKALSLNFEYITLENITVSNEREDIENSKYYTEARINQSDKLINTALASRDAYGSTQRSGVPNHTFIKYHDDFTTFLDRGWQDENGYVIVQRKLEFHNQFIKATYMATKDHNRLSEFKGIDQLYRWNEIPSSNQVHERIEPYLDYLVVSSPSETLIEEVTKINGNLVIELILGTLINDWKNATTQGKTKVTLAYVRTDGFVEEYPDDATYKRAIATPVASFGVKGGFVFGFGFESNQVAGDGLKLESGNYYNEAVRYTNKNGTFKELWFALANKYSNANDGYATEFERRSAYPLVRTTDSEFGSSDDTYFMSGSSNLNAQENDSLIYEKDRSQSAKVSLQLSVINNVYGEYIFGQRLYSNNFVVKNPKVDYTTIIGTPMYFYKYTNGTKYGKFDDLLVKSGWATKTLLVSGSNASISSNELFIVDLATGSTSWAIGDINGNLYLACNHNYSGLRAFKRHFRPTLIEIGYIGGVGVSVALTSHLGIEIVTSSKLATISIGLSSTLSYERGKDVSFNTPQQFYIGLEVITSQLNVSIPIGFIQDLVGVHGKDVSYNTPMQSTIGLEVITSQLNATVPIGLVMTSDYSYKFFYWASGGTVPVGTAVCEIDGHLGNVKCTNSGTQCEFVSEYAYGSATDDTTDPTCGQGVEKISCSFSGGSWFCEVSYGVVSTIWTDCKTCSVQ